MTTIRGLTRGSRISHRAGAVHVIVASRIVRSAEVGVVINGFRL